MLMTYAVNEQDLPAARDLVKRHQDDHISLNIFHAFYSYLPEARNDAIKLLRLLKKKEGNFLIAVRTTIDNYIYIANSEGAEFLGKHEDGIWDKEVLDLFGFTRDEALTQFSELDSFPFYTPANLNRSLCPICATDHGDLHRLGCPIEICPWCGEQLTKCNCRYNQTSKNKLTNDAQLQLFTEKLNKKGRIPFNVTEQGLTLG